MKKTELARRLGISRQHLNWLRCNRVGPEMARKLQEITGINKKKWVWPKEYGDPWEELEKL